MQQPSLPLKIAAIAGSLILAAAFVLYRAGTLAPLFTASPEPSAALADVSADLTEPPDPRPDSPGVETQPLSDSARERAIMFSGSKSGHIFKFPESDSGSGAPDTLRAKAPADTPRAMMGGSKSMAPLIESGGQPARDDSTIPRREMMGGSKSMAPLIKSGKEPAKGDTPRTQPRRMMGGSKSLAPLLERTPDSTKAPADTPRKRTP